MVRQRKRQTQSSNSSSPAGSTAHLVLDDDVPEHKRSPLLRDVSIDSDRSSPILDYMDDASPPVSIGRLKQRHSPSPLRQQRKESQDDPTASKAWLFSTLSKKGSRRHAVFWLWILTSLALATRFYLIHYPNQVVFDEVHFGKFSSYYLRRSYYFDVHPPLGKLMFAGMGYMSGFNGSYLFDKIGEDYVSRGVPYIAMRSMPAFLGAMLVPLVYAILIETKHSVPAAIFGAAMTLFDAGLVTQTRLILLDSSLIFFDVLAVFTWIKFYQYRHKPYSRFWFMWLAATGVTIALATSVKMVGLFVVGLVGVSTIIDLWRLLDIRRGLTLSQLTNHFIARALGLITVPFIVYLSFFAIHFAVLDHTGTGDAFMSPPFQATLIGNKLNVESEYAYYGAKVTFLHYDTSHFLHSHPQRYPLRYEDDRVSSQGQQVTGYPHEDHNNDWIIEPIDGVMDDPHLVDEHNETLPRLVRHNDTVRLIHVSTDRYLLTADVASPLTPTNQEFTCVERNTTRQHEVLFRIEIDGSTNTSEPLISGTSRFRLIHVDTGVAMHTHRGKLPDWGFGQQEINGNKKRHETNNIWMVHTVDGDRGSVHPEKEEVPQQSPGLLSKFAELQAVMLAQNALLTSTHPFQSSPWTWPLLVRGISFWVDDASKNAQIYLLGNPFTWWLGFFSIFLHVALQLVDAIASRRGLDEFDFWSRRRLQFTGGFFLLGWALHYLPFFIMGRALFLHHYFPALIFSYMVTANLFDFVVRFERKRTQWIVLSIFVAVFAYGFYYFMPFTYGLPLTPEEIDRRRWFQKWDLAFGKN